MRFRKLRRRLAAVAAGAALVATLAASEAGAAVTIGETFEPVGIACTAEQGTLRLATGSPPSPAVQYTVPSAGVITSWSFQTSTNVPPLIRLKVGRAASPTEHTIVGESAGGIPVANEVNTYSTRVPVEAGDVIGYFAAPIGPFATFACASTAPGYALVAAGGDLPPGTTAPFGSPAGMRSPISAQLEPDADRDGHGDETQDACPTDGETQRACPDKIAPETAITKKPPARTRSRRATFEFVSSETGGTFRCSLDGAAFASCDSPEAFRVKRGRHTFTVLARDAAGNADDMPATASWKVKKPKRRR